MLTHHEWLRINDIILIINTTSDMKKLQEYFMEAVWLLIPYDKAMFYLIEETAEGRALTNPSLVNIEDSFAERYEYFYRISNYNRLAGSAGKTMAYRDSDLMVDVITNKSNLYHNDLVPGGIEYGGGIVVAEEGFPIAEITFFRAADKGDYTEKDLAILEILSKHMEVRLGRKYGQVSGGENHQRLIRNARLIERGLTIRELELVNYIITGMTNNEISKITSISINTTKKHITNAFSKLGVNNRRELINLYKKL